MKYLNGNQYLEVKDKRSLIHPTENIILRFREVPEFLGTQKQVIKETQIRRNQKIIGKNNDQLVLKKLNS